MAPPTAQGQWVSAYETERVLFMKIVRDYGKTIAEASSIVSARLKIKQ